MANRFDLDPGKKSPQPSPGLVGTIDALNKAAGIVTANYVAAMAIEDVLVGPSSRPERAKAEAPPPGAFPFMLKVLHEIIGMSTETAEIQRSLLRELGRGQQANEIQ